METNLDFPGGVETFLTSEKALDFGFLNGTHFKKRPGVELWGLLLQTSRSFNLSLLSAILHRKPFFFELLTSLDWL